MCLIGLVSDMLLHNQPIRNTIRKNVILWSYCLSLYFFIASQHHILKLSGLQGTVILILSSTTQPYWDGTSDKNKIRHVIKQK